jgi:hypothetical protein
MGVGVVFELVKPSLPVARLRDRKAITYITARAAVRILLAFLIQYSTAHVTFRRISQVCL